MGVLHVFLVPVTRAWRDELEAKAKNAIERVLGKVTHTQEPKEMLTSAVADVDDRKVRIHIQDPKVNKKRSTGVRMALQNSSHKLHCCMPGVADCCI